MAERTSAQDQVAAIRNVRDASLFSLYDTYWVGFGANKRDPGYNDTYQEMALQEKLTFFQGRKIQALAWTNQPGDRRDWAFEASFLTAEMMQLYPSIGNYCQNPLDAQFGPAFWSTLAQGLAITIKQGDAADVIWESPLSFVPAGNQATNLNFDGSSAPATTPANNGVADKRCFLAFASPISLPAKSKLDVELRIADPIKSFLASANLPPPGAIQLPTEAGIVEMFQWYGIRISLHGVRYLQLRGAREAA